MILYVPVVRVKRKCSKTGVPLADTVSAGDTKRHFLTLSMTQKDWVSSDYCAGITQKCAGITQKCAVTNYCIHDIFCTVLFGVISGVEYLGRCVQTYCS